MSRWRAQVLTLIAALSWVTGASAGPWCAISNYSVATVGNMVAVTGTNLSGNPNAYIYIGDLTTERGRSYQALLLTAALTGHTVTYGDNYKSFACGAFPEWSTATTNPEYLRINTQN